MIVRVSPGSPSQWNATLSPRPASTWRSRQLSDTLSLPPTNHLAKGSSHSRTVSKSLVPREQLARLAGPERLGVGVGLVVERRVGDERVLHEVGGRRERAVLDEVVLDRRRSTRQPSATPLGERTRGEDNPTTPGPPLLVLVTSEAPMPAEMRQKPSAGPLDDEERAEAVRVGERLGLTDATAGADGGQITDRRPLVPDPPALLHELVDAVSARGTRPGCARRRARRTAASWSTATSRGDVLRARAVERMAAPLVGPIGAQPLAPRAGGHAGGGVGVVDHHDATGLDAVERVAPATATAAVCTGRRAPGACGASAAARRGNVGRGGHEPPRRSGRVVDADAHLVPAVRRAHAGGRRAGCRAARWPARRRRRRPAGSSATAHDDRARAGDRPARSVGVVGRSDGRAPTASAGSSGRCSLVAGPQGRRPLDQDVAQRRRARRAARPARRRASVPAPAPASTTTNGSGRAEVVPPGVERAGHHGAEQRADLGAGEEVAPPPARRPPRGVEARRRRRRARPR